MLLFAALVVIWLVASILVAIHLRSSEWISITAIMAEVVFIAWSAVQLPFTVFDHIHLKSKSEIRYSLH